MSFFASKYRILLISVIFLIAETLSGQGTHIRFKRLTINDGLSLSSVYCIFQDQKGFMWFGTEDGLNRYDGKNFTVYRADPYGNKGVSHKWTEIIIEDRQGCLWLGSRGGLSRFNPETELFTHYFYTGKTSGLTNDTITTLVEDENGNIWIGTLNGLNRFVRSTATIEQISLIGHPGAENVSQINAVLPVENGGVWIGSNKGLFHFDPRTNQCREVPFASTMNGTGEVISLLPQGEALYVGAKDGLYKYYLQDGTSIRCYVETAQGLTDTGIETEKFVADKKGNLWAGTSSGLFRLNKNTGRFELVIASFNSSNSLSIITHKPVWEDKHGFVWYGTFGSGIYKINPFSGQIMHYVNNTADIQSLSENSINCIYEDRAGVLWFGTFGAGISMYDPLAHKFDLVKHDPSNPNSLSSNFVWSVFEANDGKVWIGTNNKGINCYDPATGTFTFYEHFAGTPGSLTSSSVRKVFQDSRGNLWFGTDGGGLNKLNPDGHSFSQYISAPNNPETISNNSVRVIYEDKAGNLWIGTREGLNKFNTVTKKFTRYLHSPDDPQSISCNFIYSAIFQDKTGNIWVGTYGGGLNKMNIAEERFSHYRFNSSDPESISDDIVFSVWEDSDGFLWVGTNSGLNRFDPKTGKFRRFGYSDGLPNEVIYGILPENEYTLWLTTNLGISKFNLYDFSFKNFDVNDGLQSNEFNGGAFHKGRSGKMYFGGVYGLNILDPKKINPVENQTSVVLTRIDILGKQVKTGEIPGKTTADPNYSKVIKQGDDFYLPQSIPFTKHVKLAYNQRFVSFEFTALNNPPSEKVNYWYKMENMDQDWNYAGVRNFVTYANLKPGHYVFRVKSKNSDDKESPSQVALMVDIAPPFWETWWFILFEIVVVAGFAVFVYVYLLKIKTNKLLKIQNQKIQAANQKLTESEAKLKELNTTKDKFFSIIAHDLKNPFTSLLSISELLSKNFNSLDEEDKIAGVQGFHNSARRIYSLLENLLMWSRAQTGRIKYAPSAFDLTEIATENVHLFALPASEKSVKLLAEIPDKVIAWGDPEMINLVVRNLLHNAIKYSRPGSVVTIGISEEKNKIRVRITDEGVGIPQKHLARLFTLASDTTTTGTSGEKGSGLGLIVCREFVERHGSKIMVESEVNKGSTFSFYLRTSNRENHFRNQH